MALAAVLFGTPSGLVNQLRVVLTLTASNAATITLTATPASTIILGRT